ncbi:DNA-binding transcriptional activator of the SARP family [Amycolatopsis marina]|uniref:DNA-binding transcriptional activator of the SARP family n=2 Tax=Amycolatopsis marina TaxID=490629 RepID=A0A1I1AVQ9_9PSEU|nr:DNA-binding transcriptional activator of the SARP family [Amycolatopsis marina]
MNMVGAMGSTRRRLDEVIKLFRRRAGLTQQQAADLAGLSVAGLRDLEQGRVVAPRAGTLRRLASALELSAGEAEDLLRIGRSAPAPGQDLWVRVLGPLTIEVDGKEVDPGSARQRLLLGLLALSPNLPVSRDALIEAAWGEQPPPKVVELLQTNMSRLRRRLQSARSDAAQSKLLFATSGGYQLEVTEDQLDLLAFRKQAAQARRSMRDGDPLAAFTVFGESLSLWRGAPLADQPALRIHPSVVALSTDWQDVVIDYARVAEELGRHADVLPLLRQVVESDPLNEIAQARLMIALMGVGQQGRALSVFADLRKRLAEELGADPGPEVLDAHQRVLRQEVPQAAANDDAPVSAHRQLPPDIADFTGRDQELSVLHGLVSSALEGGPAAPIIAIEGMAGVGKTRLAVHLAHELQVRNNYYEQQLYVDLHGHANEPPAEPGPVLGSFLHLLGVRGDQIPPDVNDRAALYRDRLHDKRVLVLLDNAVSLDQVQPLLPAGSANLVLVTSRRSLALDGSHTIPLDVFAMSDAEALLVRILGRDRVHTDIAAARRVINLCGRLPLAVALVARRLQSRPAWKLGDLASRLEEAADRMGELAAGTRRVRAAFDLSYQALDPEARRVFKLLGLHPGEDFTAGSTAVLARIDAGTARGLLDHLVEEHLVIAVSGERYRLHDLLRDYARDLLTEESADDRREALSRILRWYLHAAGAARVFAPALRKRRPVLDDAPSAPLPEFAKDEDAFQWLEAERAALVAAVTVAHEQGFPQTAWQLSSVLRDYFDRIGDWDLWIRTGEVGLAAARGSGDHLGEASVLLDLSSAYGQLGDLDQAEEVVTRALELTRVIGDREQESWALSNLGIITAMREDWERALEHFNEALQYDDMQLVVFNNMGAVYQRLGRHSEAIACFRRALDLNSGESNNWIAAVWMHSLGESLVSIGQYQDAISVLEEACARHREGHAALPEAETLETLGNAYVAVGRSADARQCWEQALGILTELDHGHAGQLRARLKTDELSA